MLLTESIRSLVVQETCTTMNGHNQVNLLLYQDKLDLEAVPGNAKDSLHMITAQLAKLQQEIILLTIGRVQDE
jgi:hypothetical protein